MSCCAGHPHYCPGCGLVMSHREAIEQGGCNECHLDAGGGAAWPPWQGETTRRRRAR